MAVGPIVRIFQGNTLTVGELQELVDLLNGHCDGYQFAPDLNRTIRMTHWPGGSAVVCNAAGDISCDGGPYKVWKFGDSTTTWWPTLARGAVQREFRYEDMERVVAPISNTSNKLETFFIACAGAPVWTKDEVEIVRKCCSFMCWGLQLQRMRGGLTRRSSEIVL